MKKTLAVVAIATMALMGCDKAQAADDMMDGVKQEMGMKKDMGMKHEKMKKMKDEHKEMKADHKKIMDEHKEIMSDHKKMKKDM